MKEIRKGILLAKNDYRAAAFRIKHEETSIEFIPEWLEIYQATEQVLIGDKPISPLTELAYARTIKSLLRSITSKGSAQE